MKPDWQLTAMILCMAASLGLQGCAGIRFTQPAPSTEAQYHTHVVSFSDETLEKIAQWYTGDSGNSDELRRVNPEWKDTPLYPGATVRIPIAIMVPEQSRKCLFRRVIHPGETLSIIAQWYTGDLMNYKELIPFNVHLADPNRVKIGDDICIPEEMLITREPITRAFIDSFYPDATEPLIDGGPPPAHRSLPTIERAAPPASVPEPAVDTPDPTIELPEPTIDTPGNG